MSDQDAPDEGGCPAAQNAEIIQAGTIELAPGQLLGRDRDRDRRPWIPLNHFPVPTMARRDPDNGLDRYCTDENLAPCRHGKV